MSSTAIAHIGSVECQSTRPPLDKGQRTCDVAIACWDAPNESDRRAQSIGEFLGATVRFVSIGAAFGEHPKPAFEGHACVIMDAETAARILDAGTPQSLSMLFGPAIPHFFFGFQPSDRHNSVLQDLSSGRLKATCPVSKDSAEIRVESGHSSWCRQFSGLSMGTAVPLRDRVFEEESATGGDVLVRIGGRPFFVRTEANRFFVAEEQLADLDQEAPRGCTGLEWFTRLVPLAMFLRGVLQGRLWHNERPAACFIIDDPLLKKRHGFLRYNLLMETMRRHKFSTCIGFIPWNYRRTSRFIAQSLSTHRDCVTLCVHGCDHDNAEFGSVDETSLTAKARLALRRMQEHQKLSGVGFDDIMIFPQGLFSVEAMRALQAAGYLAAVNTDRHPSSAPQAFRLRDLLSVTVKRFSECPLFSRRYPGSLAEFAFDLFFGKPALATEHHGYFRDGYQSLAAFVGRLGHLDERIEWTTLGNICTQACLSRTLPDGVVEVQFYTHRFRLQNRTNRPATYRLLCSWSQRAELPEVTVDGSKWLIQREGDSFGLTICLEPGRAVEVRTSPVQVEPAAALWNPSLRQRSRVFTRRLLCEFRDNYIDTSRVLSFFLQVVRRLQATRKAGGNHSLLRHKANIRTASIQESPR